MKTSTGRRALIPASYVYLRQGSLVLLRQRQNTEYLDGYWNAGVTGHVETGETAWSNGRVPKLGRLSLARPE